MVTAALMVVLVALTAGLGLVLAGGGGLGGQFSGGGAKSQTTQAPVVNASYFEVKAQIEEANTNPGLPTSVLQPIPAARFVVLGLPRFFQGRPLLNQITTNSTGVGELVLPPGNYSVVGTGPNIDYNGSLRFEQETITLLSVTVVPARGAVDSVAVVNQDTIEGVEQTGTIFVVVPSTVSYTTDAFAQLAWNNIVVQGQAPVLGILQFQAAVRVAGSYSSPVGTTVVLTPLEPLSSIPTYGLTLLQYRLNSTVSYSAA